MNSLTVCSVGNLASGFGALTALCFAAAARDAGCFAGVDDFGASVEADCEKALIQSRRTVVRVEQTRFFISLRVLQSILLGSPTRSWLQSENGVPGQTPWG